MHEPMRSKAEALRAMLQAAHQLERQTKHLEMDKKWAKTLTARMKRQASRYERRQRSARRAKWLSCPEASGNPLLVRLALELETLNREAQRCALDRAAEIVGRIAEEREVLSSTSILFLVTERPSLKAAVVYNAARRSGWEIAIDSHGIVPWVAQTGKPRLVEDTDLESEDYFPDNPNTRCELAIPVIHEGTVLGVLNLESESPRWFSWDTLRRITSRIAELVPHLLVLRASDRSAKERCPWHPLVHGWDLQKVLQRLCHGFADELGSDATKCTIWYVDNLKQELFAYATYGYDWEFRDRKTLPLRGRILGRQLRPELPATIRYSPADEDWFMEKEKARALGIETGFLAKVLHCNGAPEVPVAVINVYLNHVECPELYGERERLVEEALPEFAQLLSKLIAAYQAQRQRLALSVLDRELEQQRGDTLRARLECWLATICEVFGVPAGSLFGLAPDRQALICLTSTGFRRATNSAPYGIDERDDTVEDKTIELDQHEGHTVATFYQRGRAVRRNRLSDECEKGLPLRCPARGGRTTLEFIPGERFEIGDHLRRRFLGCAVTYHGEAVGVLRLVRAEFSFPFTQCDERLIEAICQRVAGIKEELGSAQLAQHSVGELVTKRLVERSNVGSAVPHNESAAAMFSI